MPKIDITDEEILMLVQLLSQVNVKLDDAEKLITLRTKLQSNLEIVKKLPKPSSN